MGSATEKRPKMSITSPSAPHRLRTSLRLMDTPPWSSTHTPPGPSTMPARLPSGRVTMPSVTPSGTAALLSQQVQLKKTRPAGRVTSFRAASTGKSTKKLSLLAPAMPLGSVAHAPPEARTSHSPRAPTKLPPAQSSLLAYRLPAASSASSPGKPKSTSSSEKRTRIGSERRAPEAAHSLGIHVPGSRPTFSVTWHSISLSVAVDVAMSSFTMPSWLRTVLPQKAKTAASKTELK
mmetsp:Transcript_25760/g.60141  ORF Transcript_25760/g.60141 Transcript_25760/m.60141 type:complete len:235 (-) Transcript_25760:242-946(-)